MKYLILIILILSTDVVLSGQKYFTRSGTISFYSEAPIETINATNHKATSIFDMESGAMEWAVLIKAFEFKKALMQEHFNENYMESSKYPKAIFKGVIQNVSSLNFNKDGDYEAEIAGKLTIHGITNEIKTTALFKVHEGVISATSKFNVAVADYKIQIPKVVRDNIAKIVELSIEASYEIFDRS